MSFRPRLAAALLAAAASLTVLPACAPQQAPELGFTLLDGRQQPLGELRGKVVLVNFWATSCASCVAEMPDLAATHTQYAPRGYETVAVAMQYDPPAYVLKFAESRALPFKVALDLDGKAAQAFGDIRLTPTSLLIDKQGRIVKTYVGPPDFKELNALIEKLLAA